VLTQHPKGHKLSLLFLSFMSLFTLSYYYTTTWWSWRHWHGEAMDVTQDDGRGETCGAFTAAAVTLSLLNVDC
jgi:hypothetical protein